MKKFLLTLCTLLLLLPLLAACGNYDYYAHVSDERSDLFCAETEDYFLTVSCLSREHPFLTDGVASPRAMTVEVVLVEANPSGAEYEVYFLEDTPRGGDMSFRGISGDYYYSRSVEAFPEGSVSLRIVKDGTAEDILATSVKSDNTLSTREALQKAVDAEADIIERMTVDGAFRGEFHVRLLRRDKNYYYIGIVDEQGGTVSLLLDSETGELLARRAP